MKTKINNKTVRLPDFLIVGANRSGTTSLYHYLNQHPQIFMPHQKEPTFFVFADQHVNFKHMMAKTVWDFDEYVKLFDLAGEGQVIGEASTNYLYAYGKTIENLQRLRPCWQDVKIIIILRNPVERAFSCYRLYKGFGIETLEFEDAIKPEIIETRLRDGWDLTIDYLGFGFYYEQVKAYLDNFPNVKIYLFDDMVKDEMKLLHDIFQFLAVDESFMPIVREKYNSGLIPKSRRFQKILSKPNIVSSHFPFLKVIPVKYRASAVEKIKLINMIKPRMSNATKSKLQALYRDDILRLQHLLGFDLSIWLSD